VLVPLLLLLSGSAQSATAQSREHVTVTAPTATSPSVVTLVGVLADGKFDELMRNGFPLRMHMSAELWRTGGVMDQLTATVQWEIVVSYDQFDHTYGVVRVTFEPTPDRKPLFTSLGTYKTLNDARAAAELPFAPPMPAYVKGKKSYIAVQADVQTMEMSDLAEVGTWLRGDPTEPGSQAKKNPGGVLTRGIRSLFTRALGAEVRHIEGRSPTFTP
jgi:hypothetical protein